ncbi:hypothetical protein ACFCW6_16745 [Streptomyces sp. NPDC056333]|uniref:hypothetical protein n=1 Tax=Streptomyces sp. NPDC056333 TaxID=3345786 RepID=UPI0035E3A4A7
MGAGANSANSAAIGASTIRSADADADSGAHAEDRPASRRPARVLGVEPLRVLEPDLRATVPADGFRLGAAVWLNGRGALRWPWQ